MMYSFLAVALRLDSSQAAGLQRSLPPIDVRASESRDRACEPTPVVETKLGPLAVVNGMELPRGEVHDCRSDSFAIFVKRTPPGKDIDIHGSSDADGRSHGRARVRHRPDSLLFECDRKTDFIGSRISPRIKRKLLFVA